METSSSDNKSACDGKGQQQSPVWISTPLVKWGGFWFLANFLEGAKEMVTKFTPLPSDIILASFPKTCTTWLKALLYSITNRSSPNHSLLTTHNPHMLVPFLEIHIYGPHRQDLTSFPGSSMSTNNTRLFATHVPYQILDDNIYSSDCRIVYITRNPKDTIVSLWQFVDKLLKIQEEKNILEAIIDRFCAGTVPYGSYYDHVLGYWEKSLERPDKVFFVTYEELQEDTNTHVKRLSEFLGCPFETDKETEEIVQNCSIERLREHEINKSTTKVVKEIPSHAFFRQGKSGDYINYMNPEMIKKVDSITKQKFYSSGFNYGV